MPTSDVHGHRVPTGSDFAARKSLTDLSLSIMGGPKSVGSLAAANQYVADVTAALSAAGLPPISADNSLYVWRSDLQDFFAYSGGAAVQVGGLSVDWTSAVGLGGWGGDPQFCVRKGVVYGRGTWRKVDGAATIEFNSPQIGNLPASIPPPTKEVSVPATNGVAWSIGLRVTTSGLIYARNHSGSASFPDGQYLNQDCLRWPIS